MAFATLYVAQHICAGNMDIVKRTHKFKNQITLHCSTCNSVLIVSVPAHYIYLTSLSRSIK